MRDAKALSITKKALEYLLETLMPTDPRIRRIEAEGAKAFREWPVVGEDGGVFHLASYKHPLAKAALIEIKSTPNRRVAFVLGALLYEALRDGSREERLRAAPPLVLPIPITAKKKRERGWNQCELMLEGFRRADAEGLFEARKDVLVKSRENEDQVGMSRAQRFENLKDCFAVRDPEAVRGRAVVVFDDIVTTGATFGDARRALEAAGAKKVICIAIAH